MVTIGIWTPTSLLVLPLFRRLGEIQGFYDSPAAFRFTSSRSLSFFGVVGVVDDEQPVVIIQQFQPPAVAQPSEPAENRIYIQPLRVDGGYGVQVLQPGYWADPKQAAGR